MGDREDKIEALRAQIAELEAEKQPPASAHRREKMAHWKIAAIALLCAVPFVIVVDQIGRNRSAPVDGPAGASDPSPADRLPPDPAWTYSTSPDSLTGKPVHFACRLSSDLVSLDRPYGPQRTRLCIRKSPRYGTDVIFELEEAGQFVCRVRGCAILATFDGGEPLTFEALEPDDHSSDTLFIQGEKRFITNALSATKIKINAAYFRNGSQTSTFEVDRLEWPPK